MSPDPVSHSPVSRGVSRAERKAALEHAIEQQRIDLLVETSRWREAAAPIDNGWRRLMQWRGVFYAVGGLAAVQGLRKPRSTQRLFGKLVTGLLLLNRARLLYRQLRR